MATEDHACELAGSERHHYTAPLAHAMLQRRRQRIGERLIKRHRQADVAVLERSIGHGNSSITAYSARCSRSQFARQSLRAEAAMLYAGFAYLETIWSTN